MRQTATIEADGWTPAIPSRLERPIFVSAEDEREFFEAVNRYKDQSGRLFPTCSELLEVLKSLGYEKRIWKPVETWDYGHEAAAVLSQSEDRVASNSA